MDATTAEAMGARELASRTSDGVEVTLLWWPAEDRLTVCVVDTKLGDAFELEVEGERPLDVFYHPYAHAAFRGIGYREPKHAPVYA
jgi:hypothetical protein